VESSGIGLVGSAALVLLVAVVSSLPTDESQASAFVKPKPARNGLIAYSYTGDIYVGNPVTGKTTQITTDPRYEVNPVFSPNGKRIAFLRGNPQTKDSTIVVVRVDGSDERVLLPKGREHHGFAGLAWTPDGEWVLAQVDTPPFSGYGDGELSLFDPSGSGEERLLTPPLTSWVGTLMLNTSVHVAPMFRPPKGDRIVDVNKNGGLRVFDAGLKRSTPIGRDALKRFEQLVPFGPAWSPDGRRIGFQTFGSDEDGVFVMSAEGHKLRRLTRGQNSLHWQWSSDGSRIAFERGPPLVSTNRKPTDRGVITIVGLDSGKKRTLESTSVARKDAGARFPTVTYNNQGFQAYYEGWQWSPDGRSLLVLENHRTRPWVVDVERDTITKLPWLADSMPSWQRLPRGWTAVIAFVATALERSTGLALRSSATRWRRRRRRTRSTHAPRSTTFPSR
jgi:dipeptidyl aminopeptidase/acylaminoacyl peptidase